MKTKHFTKAEGNSSFSQALLWFGAAISIAEILTGALIAPLGLTKGIGAILIGHVIGAALLFPAGLIGAESGLAAIESTRISFGKYGSFGFAILNILQLIGWTAVMVVNAAKALDGVTGAVFAYKNETFWAVLVCVLICLWVTMGVKNLFRINRIVVGVLFIVSLVLGWVVFQGKGALVGVEGDLTFGAAVELSVAMSLSWLPLIADYTRNVKFRRSGVWCSVLGYFTGSSLMFIIGLGAAIYAGTADICNILLAAGLGSVALIIVVFSTVTTTFLDVYSAGVSLVNLNSKVREKIAALVVCIIGLILAIMVPISQYENFLYLIGSVFAPLFAILLTDYFILGRKTVNPDSLFNYGNTAVWIGGVIAYRLLLSWDSPLGITLPVMLLVGLLSVLVKGGIGLCSKQ
ncbi:MAG: putative hydroxymethylpyrimidine transporter CytX [Bacillota bacterium]|jgi:putative hydroxymethylpyrimidine transporter CytX